MHEAVFENRFAHYGGAFGHGVDRHELGLHVGGEGRVRRGADAYGSQPRRRLEANRIALGDNVAAAVHQLVDHGIEPGRRGTRQAHLATRGGRGAKIGAGLDAVRHDAMRRAVQGSHALNPDHVAAGTRNACAHGDQAIGQVDYFRLARRVLDHRFALSQAGGHHQVFGAGHGHHIGEQAGPLQPRRAGMHIALLDIDLGAHRGQTLDMLIHRSRADGATTRK